MADFGETHSTITLELPSGDLRVNASRLTISMDSEQIPYIDVSAECALGDGTLAAVNPQSADIWAVIEIRRLLGRVDRLGDITRRYRGKSIADITVAFRGDTLADVTRSLYWDYATPGTPRREDVRTFRVMLRGVSVDQKAATVRLSLASGEARLRDWAHMSPSTDRVPGADLIAKVNWVLALAGFPEGLSVTPPTGVPNNSQIGEEALRAPASTALDFLDGLTRKHGFYLWCDEKGLWHLEKDRLRNGTRTLYSSGPSRSVINENSTRSRDADWVTAVMIVYRWNGTTSYDIFGPQAPNPERALVLEFERPFPGPGRAEQVFKNVTGRGRAFDLDAVADYLATPGETVTYVSPRETVTGRLAAITWQLPEDEMSIKLREVKAA